MNGLRKRGKEKKRTEDRLMKRRGLALTKQKAEDFGFFFGSDVCGDDLGFRGARKAAWLEREKKRAGNFFKLQSFRKS